MKRVAQEDRNGCVCAAIAMVVGKTYQQVREELVAGWKLRQRIQKLCRWR
jgi:hypothetical protein